VAFLHRILQHLMRRLEERMIRRLLRQREEAWAESGRYRQALGLKVGEFLEEET